MFEKLRRLLRRVTGVSTPCGGVSWSPPDTTPHEAIGTDWLDMKADPEIGPLLSDDPNDYSWGPPKKGFVRFHTKGGRECVYGSEKLLVRENRKR